MSLTIRSLTLFHFVSVALLFAQQRDYPVAGQVTDSTGASVARASVTLYNRSTAESFTATTDGKGSYSLTVPRGEYLLQASAPGLNLGKRSRLVDVNGPVNLPLQLVVGEVSQAIEVTATGTPQSLDETAKAVDTVDRSEMDQRGVESVADALREIPGLRAQIRGAFGYDTTIQIRGMRTFDTAVLIDGMRFRDVASTQGDASTFVGDLLLVDTSRIEVLRGAGSSLYGTNAMGGVINMVTDSGSGPFHGSATLDGGGLGEFRGVARFGAGAFDNRLHYSVGVGHQDVTNGVGDDERYRNTTGNGLIDYTIRPGMIVSARLLAADVYSQLVEDPTAAPDSNLPPTGYINAVAPNASQLKLAGQGLPFSVGNATFIPDVGDPDNYRTTRFVSALVALQQQVSVPFSYRISYQALLTDYNYVNGPLGISYQPDFRTSDQFNGRIDTLRVQANYIAGRHQLLSAGYEFEREYYDSPSYDNNPDPTMRVNSRTQVSELSHTFDAQDQIRLLRDRLQISLSGRVQHFELSEPQFLGTVPVYAGAAAISPPNAYTADGSVAYFLRSTGTKIRSHIGNGYRKPSLFELFGTTFYGNTFTAYGDPRLKPERSVAIDGGIDQYFASDRLRLSATYYYTRLQETIVFDFSGLINPATDPFGRSYGYRNTGGGMMRGVELSSEIKPLRSTTVKTSYTYTNARDRDSEFADGTLQVPAVTPHSFSLVLLQQLGKHVDASFEFLGASNYLYPLSGRTFIFSGPRQAALSAGYSRGLSERLKMRIYGRVNNLADQTYYEDGFRTPGRWATTGVTFSF